MLRLKDLMTREVITVSPDLTLRELLEVLGEGGMSGVPVLAGGAVVGVISMTDIFDFREEAADADLDAGAAPARRGALPDSMEAAEPDAVEWTKATRTSDWDILDAHTVADVMTRNIVSQPSGTAVKKAANYMLEKGVHRILVMDDDKLQGIVTTTDIVRAVAEGVLEG
jgi:CBS domain-containing protein